MRDLDKLKPHGQEFLTRIPTLQEALWKARLIEQSYATGEDPAERIEILNTCIEPSIGITARIEGADRYLSALEGYACNNYPGDLPVPNTGLFRGFFRIEEIVEEPNETVFAKLFHGQLTRSTPFTPVVYEINSFYPVRGINHISSLAEPFRSLQGVHADTAISDVIVFSAILKSIEQCQKVIKNKKPLTANTLEQIERWDCREELLGMERMRQLKIFIATDKAIVQSVNPMGESVRTPVEDVYFTGFYAGVVQLRTKNGRTKSHIAFEVCEDTLSEVIGSQPNLPIAFVPIDDDIGLIVEQAHEE